MYKKQPGDTHYRTVPLQVNGAPAKQFQPIESNTIDCPENAVLQVIRNGKTVTVPAEQILKVDCIRNLSDNAILIPKAISTARLWVRCVGDNEMRYKIPERLKQSDVYPDKVYFIIPGGVRDMEVFGDEYFSAKYKINMIEK